MGDCVYCGELVQWDHDEFITLDGLSHCVRSPSGEHRLSR